jgi:hypothetical protein
MQGAKAPCFKWSIRMSKKEVSTIKVKVLRAFQDHEVGEVVEIAEHRLAYLMDRNMIAPLEDAKANANRAVGLEESEKKVSKRAK